MTGGKKSSTEPGDGSMPRKSVRRILEFGSPPRESSARNEETENQGDVAQNNETSSLGVQASTSTAENMPSASADHHLGTATTILLDPHTPFVLNLSASDVITMTAHDHSARAFLPPLASGPDATMASACISAEVRDKVRSLIEATEHPSLKAPSCSRWGEETVKETVFVTTKNKEQRLDANTSTSGLLQELNPGIIRQVRNSQQVRSVLQDLIVMSSGGDKIDSGANRPCNHDQGGVHDDHDVSDDTASNSGVPDHTKYFSSSNKDHQSQN